jgi:CHAD domain-containing protein
MGHASTTIPGDLAGALIRQHRALDRRWRAVHTGQVKAVHRGRVASRRLREVLAVAKAADVGGHLERLRRSVRRITRALGPVRELDVALAEFERLARAHRWSTEVTVRIRRRLEKVRTRRVRRMLHRLSKVNRQRVRSDARDVVAHLKDTTAPSWRSVVIARIDRRVRTMLAASAAAGTIYAPERLHDLRIAIKKLRYALELLPETPGFDVSEPVKVLRLAQKKFGALHDLQVLVAEVQSIDTVRAPRDRRAALTAVVETLERDCREIHAGALALMPRVDACGQHLRRDLRLMRSGRRLAMAKAALESNAVRLEA